MSRELTKPMIIDFLNRWISGERLVDLESSFGIHLSAIYTFINRFPDLRDLHAQARKIIADKDVDDMKSIADTEPDVQRARLKTDVRKWIASKYNNEQYGDQVNVNVNQSIDISDRLLEAQRRIRDVNIPNQLISQEVDTGLQPVVETDAISKSSDDIFD